jgi:hypothetical protein
MNIIEFLEARIAEDEQVAGPEYAWESADARIREWESDHRSGLEISASRLRAECAAKRAIITSTGTYSCNQAHPQFDVYHPDGHTSPALRALASIYADHPDYRQEWAE